MQCENVSSGMCGQRELIKTESFDMKECMNGEQKPK